MNRRPLICGIGVVLVIALLAALVAWSAPERDMSAESWALGWLQQLGGWLVGVVTAVGSDQDCGAEIDPNGVATPPSGAGAEQSETDRGAEIDPNG